MITNRMIGRFLALMLALAAITLGVRWLAFRRVENAVYRAHVLDGQESAGWLRAWGKKGKESGGRDVPEHGDLQEQRLRRKACWGTTVRTFRSTTAAG